MRLYDSVVAYRKGEAQESRYKELLSERGVPY